MKLKENKKIIGLALSLVFVSVFLLVNPVRAGWGLDILSGICGAIVSALGWVLIKLMGVLVYFAQYNGFIKSAVVINGWVIMRDICNMFFVLILLIIAFATILRIEEYNYKKWLPKLILMAILINFSKMICGLLIDAAQIIMLTFVNSFKDVAGANLTSALGIDKWQSINDEVKVSDWEVAASLVLAVVYVIISIVVIAAMLSMIAMRIIMLWIFVVLSPLAYLLAAFPAGKSYSSRWWKEFTQHLITGPVLAFFIWLSFTSLASFNSQEFITGVTADMGGTSAGTTSTFGTSSILVKFIVAIGLLLGGMRIARELGGEAGEAAGAGLNRLSKMGKATARGVGGAVGAVTGYNFAKRKFGEYQKETKEKIQAKSDLVYETAKGKAKGTIKGAANVVGSVAGGLEPQWSKSTRNWVKNNKVTDFIGTSDSAKKESKEKRDEKKRRYEAYTDGVYKDKDGREYKHDTATNKYYSDATAAELAAGGPAKVVAKNAKGEEITKLSETAARFKDGMRDGMNPSEALKNQQVDKKIDAQQKTLDASGVSTAELKRIMNDSAVNKNRRLAAAMTLAIKNGFKNSDHKAGRQDVNNAKALIGDNDVVLKKFNEAVNKSCAHLNHDLETEKGRADFKKGMDSGKIDGYGLDSSAYTSKELIKTLKEFSGFDFADSISRASSKSAQHRNNINSGLVAAKNQDLDGGAKVYDGVKKELNAYSKLIARLSGDMTAAFSNKDGKFDGDSSIATEKYMEMAKPSWLANFDNDQLKKNGTNDATVDMINKAMAKGIQVNTIVSLEKTGSNPETVRRLLGSIGKHEANTDKDKEIKKNNVLKNITPINPD
jgi:hypothetical protein